MIDPQKITDYSRTQYKLEEFLLFCVFVANKNSDHAAKVLDFLLTFAHEGETPLQTIRRMVDEDTLVTRLVQARTGEYRRRWRTLSELSHGWAGDLSTTTASQLEQVYGIGMKTSRFFVLHTQDWASCAVLDTHILKFMKEKYPELDVPDKTPTNPKKYRELEEVFIEYCKSKNLYPALVDLELWRHYSGRTI